MPCLTNQLKERRIAWLLDLKGSMNSWNIIYIYIYLRFPTSCAEHSGKLTIWTQNLRFVTWFSFSIGWFYFCLIPCYINFQGVFQDEMFYRNVPSWLSMIIVSQETISLWARHVAASIWETCNLHQEERNHSLEVQPPFWISWFTIHHHLKEGFIIIQRRPPSFEW